MITMQAGDNVLINFTKQNRKQLATFKECENGHIIKRIKRFDENNYRCSCHGKLIYKGEEVC